MKPIRALLLFLFIFTTAYASAELKPAQIEAFIAAYPKVQSWMGQEPVMKKLLAKPSKTSNRPAGPFEKIMNDGELNAQMEKIVKEAGFSDNHHYIEVWSSIQRIYMALTSTQQQRTYIDGFKDQLKAIETQEMSEEQKAAMRTQLQKQLLRYQKLFSVTPEEQQLFKPYMGDLKKLLH